METSLSWLNRLIDSPSGADWQRLMELYAPLIGLWTSRAGVAAADHDDLVQEVLLVVVRRIPEFEHQHPGAFRGWLRSILANHLKKYFREQNVCVCVFPIDDLADPNSHLSQLLDREHDQHLARRIMRAVQHDFTPETWTAFRRQALDGHKPNDVAHDLGLSLNAVIKARSRVLKRLRQELNRLLSCETSDLVDV